MDHSPTVRAFLQRYGRALSAGDTDAIVDCWAIPALVVSDEGAVDVSSSEQVRDFFAAAVDGYREEGLVATEPSSCEVTELAPRTLGADVVWSGLDAAGREGVREHSYYLLHLDEAGRPRIRVAVTRPVERE